MTRPTPNSGIDQIKLYTPGDKGKPLGDIRKLSSNENLYGPSPNVIAAIQEAATHVAVYPSVDHRRLRDAIAEVHDLPAEQIIIGVGSDETLALIAQAYAGIGDEVIMTAHGFEVYGIVTHAVGAQLVTVDEVNRRVDVDKIIAAVTEKTQIIYIANPANPTGTFLPTPELQRLVEGVSSNVMIVLDGAYAEFADEGNIQFDGGASLVLRYPNVIMTRTFSKLYGLGGLRVGWALADQAIIDVLNRIRGPFNMSNVALAGAEAAVRDQDYAQKCRADILADRERMISKLRYAGIAVDNSATNFVTARFKNAEQAQAVYAAALAKGYLLRTIGHYHLPEALRITVGTSTDVDAVIDIISNEVKP